MDKTLKEFAGFLEKAGYKGAIALVKDELVPLAQKRKISLVASAWIYSNPDEEQDTSWYQLFHAMQKIPKKILNQRRFHKPFK